MLCVSLRVQKQNIIIEPYLMECKLIYFDNVNICIILRCDSLVLIYSAGHDKDPNKVYLFLQSSTFQLVY